MSKPSITSRKSIRALAGQVELIYKAAEDLHSGFSLLFQKSMELEQRIEALEPTPDEEEAVEEASIPES